MEIIAGALVLSWDKAGPVKTTGTSEQDFHFDLDSVTDELWWKLLPEGF